MEEVNEEKASRKKIEAALKRLQEEEEKKVLASKFLDAKAYERLMNIRSTNLELYDQIISLIISLVKAGRLNSKLTEEQFINILSKITSRPEPTISFKHK
ncbi:MAG: DNA-binding protein [Candidatus Micrarchaeaceae archaeon]